jgi:integrase
VIRLAQTTNKRQPPVKLPANVPARLRVWSQLPRKGGTLPAYVVEWKGKPVASVKTAFATAVRLVGLEEDAWPHVLRHTAATWLMRQDVNLWEAAGYLGMTPEMLQGLRPQPSRLPERGGKRLQEPTSKAAIVGQTVG